MAAISAIVLSDPPHSDKVFEEEKRSMTTHSQSRGVGSPIPNEALRYTISSNGIHLPRAGPTQASRVSDSSPAPPVPSASPADTPNEPTSDAMELDQNDLDDDSDNDTEQGESSSTRKKKGQRFFCTGYPPCNLSFTRSEHLARHIRKHTGERPFQCHCNRRFSRLDNLRQHAQTVHVNEEIPTDSLAATGTRFQRQIRTDRVRPTGRPRTSTMSSMGSHSRGHSRNLSASSVGSTSSSYSTSTTDSRRRPPPLMMPGDHRTKSGLDNPSTPPSQFAAYSTHSPNDVGTPGSSTFSPLDHSPGFGPAIMSPLLPGPRTGFYSTHSTPARRLSVPSGSSPYQPSYPPPYHSPYGGQPNLSGANTSSNPSSVVSPTSSTFSIGAGPGFHAPPPGEDWRRRTWHPSTFYGTNFNYSRPATSGLSYSQTPDAPQPAYALHATAATGHAPRLPGIESFDQVQGQPSLPSRQPTSTTIPSNSSTLMPAIDFEPHGPRVQASSDTLRQSHFTRSDNIPTFDRNTSSWIPEAGEPILRTSNEGSRSSPETTRLPMGPPPMTAGSGSYPSANQDLLRAQHGHSRNKRQGWYNGPPPGSRTSPEDSSSSDGIPTPGTSGVEVQPAIVHSNGMVEPQHAILSSEGAHNACFPPNQGLSSSIDVNAQARASHHRTSSNDLNRLEALVAVATNETASSRQ